MGPTAMSSPPSEEWSDEMSSSAAVETSSFTELRMRPSDEDEDVEVLFSESDSEAGSVQAKVARQGNVMDVVRSNAAVVDSSEDEVDKKVRNGDWEFFNFKKKNLQRTLLVNSNDIRMARDKLTRALKRQVTAPAWKLIKDLSKDPASVDKNDPIDHDSDKEFQCTECDFRSDYRRKYLFHYELVHVAPENFRCEFCPFSSNVAEERNRHLELEHHACTECDYCGGDAAEITRHAATHSKERWNKAEPPRQVNGWCVVTWVSGSFDCQVCDFKGEVPIDLYTHVATAHRFKKLVCCKCNFTCE